MLYNIIMNPQQTYWFEELKQSDKKLERLDNIMMELIKFYFLTLFSITTAVFTLYGYKIIDTEKSWFFLIFFPPLILGFAVFNTLKKVVTQYVNIETGRNQISEWFTLGEIKNNFKVEGTPFSAFYTLLSWLVSINLFALIYFAFPFFRNSSKNLSTILVVILICIAFAGVLSSVVLASLNTARRKGRDAARKANIHNLRVPLELYFDEHGHYPVTNNFNDLMKNLKKHISIPLSDPLTKDGWSYEYTSIDGKDYLLSYTLEEGGKKSLNSQGEIQ